MKRGFCTECGSENVRLERGWTDGLGRERAECVFCNRDMNAPVQKENLCDRIEKPSPPYVIESSSDESEDRDVPEDECAYHSVPLKHGKYGPFCGLCADERKAKLRKDWAHF